MTVTEQGCAELAERLKTGAVQLRAWADYERRDIDAITIARAADRTATILSRLTVEELAGVICPSAFQAWERNISYSISAGESMEEAVAFAQFCDDGAHPFNRVSYACERAQALLDHITAETEVKA